MNPEVSSIMGETQVRRDEYQVCAQNQLGAAIAASGSALNKLVLSGINKDVELINVLSDAVRIMCIYIIPCLCQGEPWLRHRSRRILKPWHLKVEWTNFYTKKISVKN